MFLFMSCSQTDPLPDGPHIPQHVTAYEKYRQGFRIEIRPPETTRTSERELEDVDEGEEEEEGDE